MSKKEDAPRIRLGHGGGDLTGESAKTVRATILRLFAYARPYSAQLIVVAVLVMIGTICTLAGPILIGVAIDQAIIPGDVSLLVQLSLAMLGIYIVGGIAAVIYGVLMVGVGQRVVADIRAELFNHLQQLSMAYHDEHKVGDLMSRVSNDSEAVNQVLSNG